MAHASSNLPLVTVVTPVLNQVSTIRQTITSVFDQNYPRIEQVVVDGGSTDGTVAILQECATELGQRFRWRSGPDRGQSHALNIGIEMARGEIIGWQNGDDYYLPGAISTLVEALQSDPEAAVAYTGCLRIDEHGRQLDPWPVEPFSYARLLLHCLIANQSALIRRRVLLEWPLAEDTLSMDYDLWLKIGLRYRFVYVPGVGGVFRLTPWSNTGAKMHLFSRDAVRFLDQAMADPLFRPELRPFAVRVLKRKLAVAAPMLAYRGHLRESAHFLRRLVSLRPSLREWGFLLVRCFVGRPVRKLRRLIAATPLLKEVLVLPQVGRAEPTGGHPVTRGAAIELTGVGKRYELRSGGPEYATARESIANLMKRPFERRKGDKSASATTFWALRDLDLRVGHGEVLGVIGRNGSGKSTLLKLIAGVTWPTTGRIRLSGRVTPLLEVGTGFHPELTGRENVYLNGAILGMSRAQINQRFKSIVDFSGISDFIDIEVKRYSSGMHLRLAFAVAAHTDPEILLIDEVLTVGDGEYQRRCQEKVEEIASGGCTVLMVSHNLSLLTRLCERAILLEGGRLIADGPADEVAAVYLESGLALRAERDWSDPALRPGGDIARVVSVRIVDEAGTLTSTAGIRNPIGVEIEFEVLHESVVVPAFTLHNEHLLHIWTVADQSPTSRDLTVAPGRYRSSVRVPGDLLADGTYLVGVQLRTFDPQRLEANARDVVAFAIADSLKGDAARGRWRGHWPGAVRPLLSWSTRRVDSPQTPSQPTSTTSRVVSRK